MALLLVLLLFIALPIAELYVIIQVGQAIGILPTLAILLLDGFVGAALARSQGRAAWERFNGALAEGRVPARETADGAMIIVGGALLLAPGFITDVVGIALLVPPTRALLRGGVARLARRRVAFTWTLGGRPHDPRRGRRPGPPPGYRGSPDRRGYDHEGTAREVGEPSGDLPRGGHGERREH
ncbi:MAG: FxsA family protein [Solirubrobacterales bacterium]